jgi:hypothetical protein
MHGSAGRFTCHARHGRKSELTAFVWQQVPTGLTRFDRIARHRFHVLQILQNPVNPVNEARIGTVNFDLRPRQRVIQDVKTD